MPNRTLEVMNNVSALSRPVFVRLNTVGDAAAVGYAIKTFADAAKRNGESGIANRMYSLVDQMVENTPDDWDCGDPDCQSCSEGRAERESTIPRAEREEARIDPLVQFLRGPAAGEA